MILRMQCLPEQLLSIIYSLRTGNPCVFTGEATKDGEKRKVMGSVIATHPETCSFSVWVPQEELKHVA